MPLYNFVKRVITGDNKWLTISGNPTEAELLEAWSDIYSEYIDLNQDINSKILFGIQLEIATLDKKLFIIDTIVKQLRLKRNEELIEILQTWGGFIFKYVDLDADLKRTISVSKTDLIKLQKKESEYKEIIKKGSNGKQWDEADYVSQLMELGKFQGGTIIHLKDISVLEYIVLLNKFKEHIRLMEQQNARR